MTVSLVKDKMFVPCAHSHTSKWIALIQVACACMQILGWFCVATWRVAMEAHIGLYADVPS